MKIAVIGAGNVATHLARALGGFNEICQVAARTDQSAGRLASLVDAASEGNRMHGGACEPIAGLDRLRDDLDMYLVAVNDDSVADVVARSGDFDGIWAHTSGSVGMDVFKGKKRNYGVFYPLQTFSKDVDVDFSNIPMLIEGSSDDVARRLEAVAKEISGTVRMADSQMREAIHVAAVFACNFANLMWAEADRLLSPMGLDIRFMMPLLQATLDKLAVKPPFEAMTGPARRGDIAVIEKHMAGLPADLKPVYSILTDVILNHYNKPKDNDKGDE